MKKTILLTAAALMAGSVFAQNLNVHLKDGTIIQYPTDQVEFVDFTDIPSLHNGHEYVDLGLPSGLLWATCNIGASIPEENGGYFSWGEIYAKEEFGWANYQYCNNGDYFDLTKYCINQEHGTIDGLMELEPSDDAAQANWGGRWRMPTREEARELMENCIVTEMSNYCILTGPNQKSIIIPYAGHYLCPNQGSSYARYIENGFHCWTTSISRKNNEAEYSLSTDYNAYEFRYPDDPIHGTQRANGLSIRPVCHISE